jgi:hypothetical protein
MMLTEVEPNCVLILRVPSVGHVRAMARCMCLMANISSMPDRKHLVGVSSYNRIFLGEVHGRDTNVVYEVERPSFQNAQFAIPATFCPADTYFERPH